MQDKLHQEITKDFVDRHWADMAAKLDKNLPVASPPPAVYNKTLITLLTAALLLSIATTAYFAYQYNSFIPSAQLTKEKTIYKTVYVDRPIVSESNVVSKYINPAATSSRTYSSDLPVSTVVIPHMVSQTTTFSKETPPSQLGTPGTISMTTLDQLDISLATTPTAEFGMTQELNLIEVARAKRAKNYSLGVQAISTTDFEYTGLGLESSVTIPIGKRLGFSTGIALNYLSREHYFIDMISRGGQEEPVTNIKLSLLNEPETFYKGLKSLKQVYLPLGMSYAMNNNWTINSGVRLRYTYVENVDSNLAPPKNLRRRPIEDTESVFNNTNIGFTAGLRYKLNPRFSLLLDSEWGLSNFMTKPELSSTSTDQYDLNLINLTTSYTF